MSSYDDIVKAYALYARLRQLRELRQNLNVVLGPDARYLKEIGPPFSELYTFLQKYCTERFYNVIDIEILKLEKALAAL